MTLSYCCLTKTMKIYTDGSANPNPGPGGFGVIVLDNEENFVYNLYRESSEKTTNNREELKAILYALKFYGVNIFDICQDTFINIPIVFSDSAYAINTFTDWMFKWAQNDWIKSDGAQAENLDIIIEYYNLWNQGYRIELRKVPGHSNVKGNILADLLAANKIPNWRDYNNE